MKLGTILDNIDSGAIALPEFQRGYVWQRTQVRQLMDSLYRGHPVGSLLTWQTQTELAEVRGDGSLQAGTVQLLLDGQQRVTSMYGLLRGEPPKFFDGNAQAFAELRFHLEDEVFEFWQPVKMRDDKLWIDVCALFQKGSGTVITQLFKDFGDDDRVEQWMERVNRIGQISDREFHIEQVTGVDKTVDVVVDIFNRVNSGGTKLSKGDLALAKICAEWPSARDEMKLMLAKWRRAGFEFKLDFLLRVVNALVTGKAPFSALADVEVADVKAGLKDAEKAIDKILNAVSSRLGLDHGTVMPNVFPFVIMARYIADRGMSFGDHAERDKLLYWFVQASMWGRFAGSTETFLAQDLTTLAEADGDPIDALILSLRRQRGDLSVRPDDFRGWSRGSRFFSILYMLTRVEGSRDWGTGEKLNRHALGKYSDLELHHIFPKKLLYDAGFPRPEVNAVANFTFLSQETNGKISATPPSTYIPKYQAEQPGAVESHWIPMDPGLWTTENYVEFLERRRELLAEAANRLLERLLHGRGEKADDLPVDLNATVSDIAALELAPDEQEELELEGVEKFVAELGLGEGVRDYELVDEDGSIIAVLDLAWPDGLQSELSDPTALLLNEPTEVPAAASTAGFRVFVRSERFKEYAASLASE